MNKEDFPTMELIQKIANKSRLERDAVLSSFASPIPSKELEKIANKIINGFIKELIEIGCDMTAKSYTVIRDNLGWQSLIFLELVSEALLLDVDYEHEDAADKEERESLNIFLFNSLVISIENSIERINKERKEDKTTIKSLMEALNAVKENE